MAKIPERFKVTEITIKLFVVYLNLRVIEAVDKGLKSAPVFIDVVDNFYICFLKNLIRIWWLCICNGDEGKSKLHFCLFQTLGISDNAFIFEFSLGKQLIKSIFESEIFQ